VKKVKLVIHHNHSHNHKHKNKRNKNKEPSYSGVAIFADQIQDPSPEKNVYEFHDKN